MRVLETSGLTIADVDLHPDGTHLLTLPEFPGGRPVLWDVTTGTGTELPSKNRTRVPSSERFNSIVAIRFRPGHPSIVGLRGDGQIDRWPLGNPSRIPIVDSPEIGLDVTSDSDLRFTAENRMAIVHAAHRQRRTDEEHPYRLHRFTFPNLTSLPTDLDIGVVSAKPGNHDCLIVLEVATQVPRHYLWKLDDDGLALQRFEVPVRFVSDFSPQPEGSKVALLTSFSVVFVDLDRDEVSETLEAHKRGVTAVAYLHVGDYVLTAGRDGFVRLWDVAARNVLEEWDWNLGSISHLAVAAGGGHAVAVCEGGTVVWDLEM